MNRYSLLLSITAFAYGCSPESEKPRELVYANDAEQYFGWSNQNTLKQVSGAHSGTSASVTDSSWVYSLTFREKVSELEKVNARKASVKAWVKFKSLAAKGGLVLSIDDNGKSLQWELLPLESVVKNEGVWKEVKLDVMLKKDIPPTAVVSVYMWNTSKEEIMLDDMQVKFIE